MEYSTFTNTFNRVHGMFLDNSQKKVSIKRFTQTNKMANSRPIIILEDDEDDQELIEEAIREIGYHNKIIFFKNGEEGEEYLRTTKEHPFIIISDLKMPRMDGLEFKMAIDKDQLLQQKRIPFVFLTTSSDITVYNKVVSQTTILGYFVKPNNYHDFKYTIKKILDYWGSQSSFA